MICAAPFMTWEIFSRDDRSWMPMLATPIGQKLFPAHAGVAQTTKDCNRFCRMAPLDGEVGNDNRKLCR